MDAQPDIAQVAAHFADPARSRIVLHLIDGRAQPASLIAVAAGIAPSTASAHLARLVDGGVLSVEQHGRHRYYKITDPRVASVVEALLPLAESPQPNGLKAHNRMRRLRGARTCYDHAAGQLGTAIMLGLLDAGALVRTDGRSGIDPAPHDTVSSPVRDAPYALGPRASITLAALGLDLERDRTSSRPLVRACMDWTEQRHHLAGALGAMILESLLEHGWVRRSEAPRELVVTSYENIREWLAT